MSACTERCRGRWHFISAVLTSINWTTPVYCGHEPPYDSDETMSPGRGCYASGGAASARRTLRQDQRADGEAKN